MVSAESLFPLPAGNPQQLAMIGSNPPTAVLALDEFVDVPPGSFVAQDAANSGVGSSMIAFTHARGLRTVNFARNETTFAELTAAGADLGLPDRPESVAVARKFIGDAPVRVAIDALGGPSTETLTALPTSGGALMAYSAESGSLLSAPYFDLTGKQLTVRGSPAGGTTPPRWRPRSARRPRLHRGGETEPSGGERLLPGRDRRRSGPPRPGGRQDPARDQSHRLTTGGERRHRQGGPPRPRKQRARFAPRHGSAPGSLESGAGSFLHE